MSSKRAHREESGQALADGLIPDEGKSHHRVDEDVVGVPDLLEVGGPVQPPDQLRVLGLKHINHQVVLRGPTGKFFSLRWGIFYSIYWVTN